MIICKLWWWHSTWVAWSQLQSYKLFVSALVCQQAHLLKQQLSRFSGVGSDKSNIEMKLFLYWSINISLFFLIHPCHWALGGQSGTFGPSDHLLCWLPAVTYPCWNFEKFEYWFQNPKCCTNNGLWWSWFQSLLGTIIQARESSTSFQCIAECIAESLDLFFIKVLRLYQVEQFYTILAAKNLQTFKLLFSMWAWSNIYLFGCWCEFIIALICNNINFSIQ